MSDKKSTGGAATNRGIWYQALWCVLSATSARIKGTDESEGQGGCTLDIVLEPLGGDEWLQRPGGRRVVQLKTLSNGTWSIKSVVEEVLPDLYRAVAADSPRDTTYEFVTEGGLGDWSQVLDFFDSLDKSIGPSSSASGFKTAYATLDDSTELEFAGSTGEFWGGACTRRALLDRIVAHLRTKAPAKNEGIEETRRKTWHMLARFHFKGCVPEEDLHHNLCEELLPFVHHREDIPTVLDAMVGWIIKRSSDNETTITPEELFEAQNLKYVLSISQSVAMKDRCRTQCRRDTELRGYRPEWDVRFSEGNVTISPGSAPFVVVCGDSGLGKSWWLYAQSHVRDGLAPVILDSNGETENDLRRAANRVWQDALGHDTALPLQNLAQRTADVLKRHKSELWLRICLDRLTSTDEARKLLNTPVEDCGIQVIVACNEQVAQVFETHKRDHPRRVQLVRLDGFTPTERDKYLAYRLGDEWVDLPADVRELLRKPQLGDLYCQLFKELGTWQPQNEYELIEKFWQRLEGRDALHLASLAATLCSDAQYPWDEGQLESARIDPEGARRMSSVGWLRRSADTRYEVPHRRLLNFAVAMGLANSHRSGSRSDQVIADLLRRMLNGDASLGSIMLGYVPMDWFFLRLKDEYAAAEDVLELVGGALQYRTREVLYRDLLPTLGVVGARPLVSRLVTLAAAGNWFETKAVVAGLSTRPTGELRDSIVELLGDARPRVQRSALLLLAQHPLAEALDKVWKLHIEMQSTPEKFFGDDIPTDRRTAMWLYDDSFNALRECARLDPAWVVSAIRSADSETEPVHDLGYVTANLRDKGNTWRTCKGELFEKVSLKKRRCLALNIGTWKDSSELQRLTSWIDVEEDLLGPASLRALAQVDPKQATQRMSILPERLQYFCRGWHLPRLMLTAPEETRDQLHNLVRQSKDPLTTSRVFQGFENEIDGSTLEILLDALDEALATVVDKSRTDLGNGESTRYKGSDSLYVPMNMLAAVGRRDLLSIFESRRGTRLEERLECLLTEVIGARCILGQDNLIRKPALNVLLKIGGDGYGRVVSAFLDAESQYGKLDAIEEARKTAGHEGTEKLRRIALSDQGWNDTPTPILQMESMQALASVGDGDGVLSAALHLGLDVPEDIAAWLRPGIRPAAKAMEEAVRIVRQRDTAKLPGALISLGLFGCAEALGDMIAVLGDPPDSKAELAAVRGLGRLGEPADAAVALIGKCIANGKLRHAAVVALERIGTNAARSRLLASLEDSWDIYRAIWLTQFSEVRAEALEKITGRLRSTDERAEKVLFSDVDVFLAQASEAVLSKVLRSLPVVGDGIREAAFAGEGSGWIVGSKAFAIRGLAAIDSGAAFLAARKVLADVDAHDRHLYAPLLSGCNAEEARETLLRLAATEKNNAVLWSMAHTMRPDDVPWLVNQLASGSTNIRLAACCLGAGIASDDNSIRERLLGMLADPDERVASAAEQSLRLIRRQQRASELAKELDLQEREAGLKPWVLVDAALQVGDSGYEGTQWPPWVKTLADSKAFKAHPALLAALQKRIGEKRKKSLQDANR